MKTWLLMAIDPSERLYRGHGGYVDELRLTYRYDSFVPNHRNVGIGDAVLLRDKTEVRGCAVVENIVQTMGQKRRNHCPTCGATKIKERSRAKPRFRCECGAEFDIADEREESCTQYEAQFGNSFQELQGELAVRDLWLLAPRLNKQLAMLELDSLRVASLLAARTTRIGRADEPTAAARALYTEGERTTVLVNRYERDPRARAACLEHHGTTCTACGFSFFDRYGDIGRGIIEVHHLSPLASSGSRQHVDPVEDLRPLCANCHTIVHQRTPPLEIEELRSLLAARPAIAKN
jgi:hypothetical protein